MSTTQVVMAKLLFQNLALELGIKIKILQNKLFKLSQKKKT